MACSGVLRPPLSSRPEDRGIRCSPASRCCSAPPACSTASRTRGRPTGGCGTAPGVFSGMPSCSSPPTRSSSPSTRAAMQELESRVQWCTAALVSANMELQQNQSLLAETERLGKVGGWTFDIETLQQTGRLSDPRRADSSFRPTVEEWHHLLYGRLAAGDFPCRATGHRAWRAVRPGVGNPDGQRQPPRRSRHWRGGSSAPQGLGLLPGHHRAQAGRDRTAAS